MASSGSTSGSAWWPTCWSSSGGASRCRSPSSPERSGPSPASPPARRPWRWSRSRPVADSAQIVPLALVNLVSALVFVRTQPVADPVPDWIDLSLNIIIISAMVAWGMYIGSRRELLWTLRHRAERAEAEQELRVGQARATERARIAREMHDVLAHRISQISMHAGALAFRTDLGRRRRCARAPRVIQEKAHEALTDLRGVLGVLRDDQTGELLNRPQPTYADLPRLVEEARESGLNIDFADGIDQAQPVPDVVGRTIYRIVQEGITNARKHAPGALLTIEVGGSPDDGIDLPAAQPAGLRTQLDPRRRARPDRPVRARRAARRPARAPARRPVLRAERLDTVGGVKTQVLIVDDDPLVRSALSLMLGGQPDVEVVGEAADGRQGVEQARSPVPRRGPDGHPDAGARRARGHPRAARAAGPAEGDRADHLRRRRARARRAGRGRRRVPAQGHPAHADPRRDPQGRRRRPDAVAVGDPHPDRPGAQRRRRRPVGRRQEAPQRADRARARRGPGRRPRAQQRRDRQGALPVGADGQGARVAALREARWSPTAYRSRSASTTPSWTRGRSLLRTRRQPRAGPARPARRSPPRPRRERASCRATAGCG